MTEMSFTYYGQTDFFHGHISKVMGTRFDALVRGLGEAVSRRLWEEIAEILSGDESVFNRFSPESELSRVNAALKTAGSCELGEELKAAFLCARHYRQITGGLFDISRKDLSEFTLEGSVLSISCDSADLDFGGFAKGWTLKKIVNLLRKNGVISAFLDFGGSSICGLGAHPAGDCWQVDLNSPFDGSPVASFSLHDTALSVSGNTPAYSSHIINPHTGKAVCGKLMTSVLSADPLEAEVLSTAAMMCSEEELDELKSVNLQIERYTL